MRDFLKFMPAWKSSKVCARGKAGLLPSVGALLAALAALAVGACHTGSFQPIVIDVSNKTPPAAAEAATATPVPPPPTATRPVPVSTPAPRSEPAAVPSVRPVAPASGSVSGGSGRAPEAAVDGQNAAFNRHDLDTLVSFYSPDAIFYGFPDRVRHSGIDEIRRSYAKGFAESPSTEVKVSRRLLQGAYVIDQETISGLPGGQPIPVVAIYEIRDGRIRRLWYVQ